MSRREALFALLTRPAFLPLYLRDTGGIRCDENLEAGCLGLDIAERTSAQLLLLLDFNLTGALEACKGNKRGKMGRAQSLFCAEIPLFCLHQSILATVLPTILFHCIPHQRFPLSAYTHILTITFTNTNTKQHEQQKKCNPLSTHHQLSPVNLPSSSRISHHASRLSFPLFFFFSLSNTTNNNNNNKPTLPHQSFPART